MRKFLFFIAVQTAAGIALAVWAGSAASAQASFQGLGDLPGGQFASKALAVSADGSTVVGFSDSNQGNQAFCWTREQGMVGLGSLPAGTFSYAWSVSADGSVVAGEALTSQGTEAFIWKQQTGMQGLGDLPGGGFMSRAFGMSGNGQIVAGDSESENGQEAFRWTEAGGMVGLGDLRGGQFTSMAKDVSTDGKVIVGLAHSAEGREPFRWTADEGMVGLGNLPGLTECDGVGVSADGRFVVGYGYLSLVMKAFRWEDLNRNGRVDWDERLDEHPEFSLDPKNVYAWSRAEDVSADGVVVGVCKPWEGGFEAFIWDPLNGMRTIKDVLINDYGLDLSGWVLTEAMGISDDGLTIVGSGWNPSGHAEAWIAVLPEPSIGLTGLIGIAILAGRRRHN